MTHPIDLDLSGRDIAGLTSADALAAWLSQLGYDTGRRAMLMPEVVGLTGDSAAAVRTIELLSEDPEGFLRVVFVQPRSLTARVRNDLARALGKGNLDHLLILTPDFDTLEFVLLDKRKREARGPASGPRIQVLPRTLSINRRNPDRLNIRVLRRLTWTCRDGLDQYDKLRSVFEGAAFTGEYFQNRALFADYYLRDRLPDDGAWKDNPATIFGAVRDLYRDASSRWLNKGKEELRAALYEPLFRQMGFRAARKRPTDQTQPDYLLSGDGVRPLTGIFVYPWERWLDGADGNDRDTPDENPGACVVSALDRGVADWIIVTNGKLWRLYSRQARARATNFYEVDVVEALAASGDTDPNEAFRFWWLFFRPEAFQSEPSGCWLDRILQGSRDYARRLGERLKDRIFVTIFPHLARGFLADRRRLGQNRRPTDEELSDVFEATLTLLYRLLFLLYAESRDLVPVREGPYHAASLKKIKEEVAEQAGVAEDEVQERLTAAYSDRDTGLYDRLSRLFEAMDHGDPALNLPRYSGALFITEPDDSERREQGIARFLREHKVPDRYLALALDRLARDQDEKTLALVFIDYKSLEVRHLGSIYEGLLEFKLKVADEDLTTRPEKNAEKYIPLSQAKPKRGRAADVVVRKGEVYLSNDKADRKATGSYYTPDSIVEYIVENTVGPVLDEKLEALRPEFRKVRKTYERHLENAHAHPGLIPRGTEPRRFAVEKTYAEHKELVERLFELRVLDPAMGSGHFLVEAVDFITDRLLKYLMEFPVNPVSFALERTRNSILESLSEQGVTVDPDKLTDINLLKRHVLKCSIYGVDINPMAVELAKVSLWLDAFTLGAPLSFLDHHLRPGNSLIGATFAELEAKTKDIFYALNYEPLMRAIQHVLFVNRMADATAAEASRSAREYDEARKELSGYQIVLDLLVAGHFGYPKAPGLLAEALELDMTSKERLLASLQDEKERQLVKEVEQLAQRPDLRFFHWEVEFPEVFFGFTDANQRQIKHKDKLAEGAGGFDAVIGNPPYIRTERMDPSAKNYFASAHPEVHDGKADIYFYFVSTAGKKIRTRGKFGLIVSNAWLQTASGQGLRHWISDTSPILRIIDFETIRPFEDADMRPAIILASGAGSNGEELRFAAPRTDGTLKIGTWVFFECSVSTDRLLEFALSGWSVDRLACSGFHSIAAETFNTLTEVGRIYSGIKPGATAAFVVSSDQANEWIKADPTVSVIVRPFFRGQDILRYQFLQPDDYLLLVKNEADYRLSPVVQRHLRSHRALLEARDEVRRGATPWFALRPCDYYHVFSEPLLVWPDTAKDPRFCLLPAGSVIGNTAFAIPGSAPWLLPILNSGTGWRIISLICQSRDERAGKLRYRLLPQYMCQFPIPNLLEQDRKLFEEVGIGGREHSPEVEERIALLYQPLGLSAS